jgi:hypothetical protein
MPVTSNLCVDAGSEPGRVCNFLPCSGHALRGDARLGAVSGMTVMCLLMSAFHSSPWLKLIANPNFFLVESITR